MVESILERVRRTHAEIGRLMSAVDVESPDPPPESDDLTEAEHNRNRGRARDEQQGDRR